MEDAHKSHNHAERDNEAFPCQLSRLFTLILFISQAQDWLKLEDSPEIILFFCQS